MLRNTGFMDNSQQIKHLKCPFCLNHSAGAKPGKTTCPECSAEFEIDDRLECIFADISKIRIPVHGFVCSVCGLVQSDHAKSCFYCGTKLCTNLQ
jgi:hypothetical protein